MSALCKVCKRLSTLAATSISPSPPPPSFLASSPSSSRNLLSPSLMAPFPIHTGSFNGCGTRWHQEHNMRFKEFSTIKWRPLSIFFSRSVAFILDIITLNTIFVTAVSYLANTEPATNEVEMKINPHAYESTQCAPIPGATVAVEATTAVSQSVVAATAPPRLSSSSSFNRDAPAPA